jgi:hypothetical protein
MIPSISDQHDRASPATSIPAFEGVHVQADARQSQTVTEPTSAAPRRSRLRLIHSFLILGGMVVLLGAFTLSYFNRSVSNDQFTSLAEQNNVALTQAFANAVWPDFESFLTGAGRRSAEDIRGDPNTAALKDAAPRC